MKPVFKCEYCDFMGTKEDVEKHESECVDNYDKRSCMTCKYVRYKNFNSCECITGKIIPEGKMFEYCPSYERKEKTDYKGTINDLFGGIFNF